MFAQSFFSQKATRIKNLIQQVSLSQVYISDLERGYDIAMNGLATIGDIKRGDFQLAFHHFAASKLVNSAVRQYAGVADMVLLVAAIRKLRPAVNNDYTRLVFQKLLIAVDTDIDEFNKILLTGYYAFSDAERVRRLRLIKADLLDKYHFAQSFAADCRILSAQQLKSIQELHTSRLLNNLQP